MPKKKIGIKGEKKVTDLTIITHSSAIKVVLWIVFFITIVVKFVPLSPTMPSAGLDPSWQYAINQAVDEKFAFGKDIIFTFGPYASIYSRVYHPSTDFMMIAGSFFLAAVYWLCLIILLKGVGWYWGFFFCFALAGLRFSPDALLFSFPLVLSLGTFNLVMSQDGKMAKANSKTILLIIMFAPLGLLPLIKGSIIITCISTIALCSVFLIFLQHNVQAIICILSPSISLVFFWILSGQSMENIPNYFRSMTQVSSGYTEAMAYDGNSREILFYIFASAFLSLAILWNHRKNISSGVFLFCIYFIFLFLSFKAGFVRHDAHARIAATSILIAALLFPFNHKTRLILPVLLVGILTWYYIDSHYHQSYSRNPGKVLMATYKKQWTGIAKRFDNKNRLNVEFNSAIKTIQAQSPFQTFHGTADIYSYNQSYLISSGSEWAPRPIFQSYAVFSPSLAEINRNHIKGPNAPENIIFGIEPIDERFPALEDGPSWPVLLANYYPDTVRNNYIFLKKNKTSIHISDPIKLREEICSLGETVYIPQSEYPIFARIEIDPTFLGRMASLLFKPDFLYIFVELKNGIKKRYRIPAGMAQAGFVITPLIETTIEFAKLYEQNRKLAQKKVNSIILLPRDQKTWFWKNKYKLFLYRVGAVNPSISQYENKEIKATNHG